MLIRYFFGKCPCNNFVGTFALEPIGLKRYPCPRHSFLYGSGQAPTTVPCRASDIPHKTTSAYMCTSSIGDTLCVLYGRHDMCV